MPPIEDTLPTIPFLADFVIVLAVAVAVILASHAFRLPSVVGLLLTGILIGPHGLALVTDEALIDAFAEIGVVFLLFTVGLEFSLERLREVGRAFFVAGPLQAGLTIGGAAAALAAFGRPAPLALFYGFLAVLSSTAILLKLYGDRRELGAPHGKLLIGILLFQDFLMVPLIILTPALAGDAGTSAGEVATRIAVGLVVVVAVFGVARTLMPRLLHALVGTRIRELLVLGALLVGLGMALVTEAFGFSLALGAFLAGILIAESVYSHQVVAEMAPFRDVFASLFFVAIGMLLDMEVVLARPGTVLLVVVGVMALKTVSAGAAVAFLRFPVRTTAITALSLAQIGEFSFVVAQVGLEAGLLPALGYQVFLAAAIATMMATPFLVRGAPAVANILQRLPVTRLPEPVGPAAGPPGMGHVIVVGFGVNGRNLARVLRSVGIPYVALDLNGEVVKRALAEGEPILFGDVTRRDVLEACGIDRAAVLVIGISDPAAVRRGVRLARATNPGIHIIVRTVQVAEIDEIVRAGADEVVAAEFETSIEIFTRVLERFRVPPNIVEAQVKVLRGDAYRRLRRPRGPGRVSKAVLDVLAAGTTAVFHVPSGSPADGATIAGLDLRRRAGATIIAVVRGEEPRTNPPPDFRVEAGDSLVLVGSHAEIDRAFELLEGRATESSPSR